MSLQTEVVKYLDSNNLIRLFIEIDKFLDDYSVNFWFIGNEIELVKAYKAFVIRGQKYGKIINKKGG